MEDIKSLTTGMVAKYCHVSQATIVNWIKQNKLRAYKTPGGHYRILQSNLLSFLKAHGMPIDPALRSSSHHRVLIVGNGTNGQAITRALGDKGRFEILCTDNDYDTSAQIVRWHPDVILLDTSSEEIDWIALCQWLQSQPDAETPALFVIGDGERDKEHRWSTGVAGHLDSRAIPDRLETALETLFQSLG